MGPSLLQPAGYLCGHLSGHLQPAGYLCGHLLPGHLPTGHLRGYLAAGHLLSVYLSAGHLRGHLGYIRGPLLGQGPANLSVQLDTYLLETSCHLPPRPPQLRSR